MREQLAATTIDVLREQTWALAGGKETDRPDPIERPGVETNRPKDILTATGTVGGIQGGGLNTATIEDPRDWLDW